MINMAFMPLYMWEMRDVTPVTYGRTVESSAVFLQNPQYWNAIEGRQSESHLHRAVESCGTDPTENWPAPLFLSFGQNSQSLALLKNFESKTRRILEKNQTYLGKQRKSNSRNDVYNDRYKDHLDGQWTKKWPKDIGYILLCFYVISTCVVYINHIRM